MATIAKTTNPLKPWRVQIRRKGLPNQSQYFATNADAKKWARAQEAQLDKNPTVSVGLKVTYQELTETYIEKIIGPVPEGRREPRAIRDKRRQLRLIAKEMGPVRLSEMRGSFVHNYAQRLKERRLSGGTVKKRTNMVMMVLAHAGGFLNAEEPCALAIAHMKTARKMLRQANAMHQNRRTRRPTPEEIAALRDYFRESFEDFSRNRAAQFRPRVPMEDIILFAICSCMRINEVTKIVWEDFSSANRTVWIRDRKDPSGANNRNDEVPLLCGPVVIGGEVINPVEIINRQPTANRRSGRIFPFAIKSVQRLFCRACKELGIRDLHFHDFRHEGVSRLFESGRPIEEVSMVSGHRSWTDLKIYTNLNPASLHRDQPAA
jgi:integrase